MNYNQKIGKFGERLACDYLIRKGYKILNKNIKLSYQEIDIIAQKNKIIIFIEVKTRTSYKFGAANDTFSSQKMKNLHKAVENYIYKNKIPEKFISIDLISIDIDKYRKIANIKHYKNIF